MYDDPKFRYPNTDDGKDRLMADLNLRSQTVQAKLPHASGLCPRPVS